MRKNKNALCITLSAAMLLAACSNTGTKQDEESKQEIQTTESINEAGSSQEVETSSEEVETVLEKIDMTKWQYNEETNVYWQVGISYCATPADASYENLGIFVPAAYFNATDNGNGTFTCELNESGTVGAYTVDTAPIVIPVDTPGYAAMSAPTNYVSSTADYTNEGFIYVYAGCRGRDAGAPAGVTDLKAAIRYIRYNEDILPGSIDRIFSFGMSGGGAQSALLGATGDSDLYTPYLEAIGAVTDESDAVAGSMCWCPITNLDYASEAYEWNLGVTRTDLTEELQQLSDEMAEAFALYVNELELKDETGTVLTLTESDEGIYQAGSYYEYLKSVIEGSLNNFLADTTFPYDASSSSAGIGRMDGDIEGFDNRGGFGADGVDLDRGDLPELDGEKGDFTGKGGRGGRKGDLELPDGDLPEGDLPGGVVLDDKGEEGYYAMDGITRGDTTGGLSLTGTYETPQDYIDALNEENTWISYDSETNTVTITSIADFVSAFKIASKNLGAFDELDRAQGENVLFGYGDGEGAHFDATMASLLADSEDYGAAYAEDLERKDALGNTVDYRVNMYNPLYYLCDYYEGVASSNVASYWRIRSGINQSDTALTTEVNLALALENAGKQVDFETVWGMGHVQAERTGDSTSNFIAWVNECLE